MQSKYSSRFFLALWWILDLKLIEENSAYLFLIPIIWFADTVGQSKFSPTFRLPKFSS